MSTTLALALLLAGVLLAWGGITGHSPLAVLTALLNGRKP